MELMYFACEDTNLGEAGVECYIMNASPQIHMLKPYDIVTYKIYIFGHSDDSKMSYIFDLCAPLPYSAILSLCHVRKQRRGSHGSQEESSHLSVLAP